MKTARTAQVLTASAALEGAGAGTVARSSHPANPRPRAREGQEGPEGTAKRGHRGDDFASQNCRQLLVPSFFIKYEKQRHFFFF